MSELRTLLETAVDRFTPTEEHLDRTIGRARRRQRRQRITATVLALAVAGAGIGLGFAAFSGHHVAVPGGILVHGNGSISFNRIKVGRGLTLGPRPSRVDIVAPGGGSVHRLAFPAPPVWSPTGRQVVYSSTRPNTTGGPRLYVANADGSNPREFPSCRPSLCNHQTTPSWAPNGTRIAFSGGYRPVAGAELRQEIYVASASGSGLTRVTDCVRPACASAWAPTWSPDGREIAYWAIVKEPSATLYHDALQVVDLPSGRVRTIHSCRCDIHSLSWSPSGDRIVFSNQMGIDVIHSDGTGLRRLATCRAALPECGLTYSQPVWSPDGRFIAFSAGGRPLEKPHAAIWVMRSDGSDLRQITTPPAGWGDFSPSWQRVPPDQAAPQLPPVSKSTSPERPGALALGPNGRVYIADDRLNEILESLPGGAFKVVAGTGTAGFSGDGGPAAAALLNAPGGMAVAGDGTLFFADTGNNRIRAISSSGIISTVAGDGRVGWISSGTPALKATVSSPSDVTIGHRGHLFFSTWNEILRVTSGTLARVAGIPGNREGLVGIGGPATGASVDGPSGLAFDRAGNLYVAGFNTKTLLMVTAGGTMTLPAGADGFYPHGEGGLVSSPDGGALAINQQRVVRVTPHGLQTVIDFGGHTIHGIHGFLPNGIAVASNGAIYLDTFEGNGYANATALIEILPDGSIDVLWRS